MGGKDFLKSAPDAFMIEVSFDLLILAGIYMQGHSFRVDNLRGCTLLRGGRK
jgi:hypothetical protein